MRIVAAACLLLCAATVFAAVPAEGKVTIVPESFLRGYDPVTVFFPSAVGPAVAGPEDHPEKWVRCEPVHPGEWRWVDARTLIFKPAVPWPPLTRFRLAAGDYRRTLTTMMIPPAKVVPADGASDVENVDEIVLSFGEPVEKLSSMVSFEVRPLPGVDKGDPRWLSAEQYTIKPLERASAKDPASYVFRFKQPFAPGVRVITHLRLSLDDGAPGSLAEYTFATRQPFRIVSAGCIVTAAASAGTARGRGYDDDEDEEGYESEEGEYGEEESYEDEEGEYGEEEYEAGPAGGATNLLPMTVSGSRYTREQAIDGGTGQPQIAVCFSSESAALTLSAVKSLLRLTPSIREMTFSQSGRYLYITGKIERDTVYRATLQPAPIVDRSGRPLLMTGASEFYVYFPHLEPFLHWSQASGIIERYGPQVFPMAARGESSVDVRVYKIDPLDRSFWPFPGNPVSVRESERPPGPGEEPLPADTLRDYVNASELALRLMTLGSPLVSRIVPLPIRREGGSTTFGLPLKKILSDIAGADAPGTYLVGMRRLGESDERQYVRVQVTDLCLSTIEEQRSVVFVVTSLRTGKPVPGASVQVEGIPSVSKEARFVALVSGTTDARGLLRYEHGKRIEATLRRILVRNGADTLVLLPSDPPYSFANNHWYGPSGTWLGWLTDDPRDDPERSRLLCHLLTERPVYRPAEEVHIKLYLRTRRAGRLELPLKGKYEIVITAPGENPKMWNIPVELTPEGTFYYRFQEKDLPTGQYRAELHDVVTNTTHGSVDWKMEAYKVPRFEVTLHGPDRVPMDREFSLSMTAAYYAGGRVVGQPVMWRVTQHPYVYVPEGREGYLFSSDERYGRPGRFQPGAAIEKSDKTDDSGASTIAVNPALQLDGRPRQYAFECTVTGSDEQTVTATRGVLALPPFVLGVQVDRFQKKTPKLTPKVLALDVNNQLLTGLPITVRLLAREWHSHLRETDFANGQPKYETEMVDREVYATTAASGSEPLQLDLPIEKGGVYVVEVSARDTIGRLQLVAVDLFVAGDEPVAWKKPEANVFETVTDKKEYRAGETAQIVLKSPFQQADVLAVVEGPDGCVYHEFQVAGGKAVFALPIRNEFNPRIPVHFVLMRGRILAGSSGGTIDLGKPTTMAATHWVKVKPADNELAVDLRLPERALPGQEIAAVIKLSTPDGKPLAGEACLWLVDQAVLSLGVEKRLDPLPSFITDVRSRLSIRDTRNSVIGDLVTVENPGGGGAEGAPELLGKVTVRKEFQAVPYFNPRIMVDASGTAEVRIKLSDDLTVFKVRCVACSGPDRFGAAKSQVAVRLPVIVQPALPRFARAGDRVVAGGIGRIVEGEGGAGSCQIQVEGAELEGESRHALQWVKDKPEKLFFPMTIGVPSGGKGELTVRLAVTRAADKASDAFEVKIPVRPDREPLHFESFARLQAGASASFPEMKEKPRANSARQSILMTDQDALLRMISGLDYLLEYTHECTEQRVSQAFPAIALRGILDAYKLPRRQEKVREILDYTFDYLGKTQQPSGLYSFWPGGRGSVSLTAYVVEFLAEARRNDYPFPAKLLDRSVPALKEALRSDYSNFVDGASFIERSEALLALSNVGEFDVSYGSELARKVGVLDLYSEAQVVRAYTLGQKGGRDATQKLRDDLWNNLIFKLREGREVYGGLQSRMKTWNAVVLASEVKTQAALLRALRPWDFSNPKYQLMLGDLLERGQKDGWGNTNTNASALLALRDIVAEPRKDQAPASARVEFGNATGAGGRSELQIGPDQPAAFLTSRESRPGRVSITSATAPVFARMEVTYVPEAPGDTAPATSDGFVVRREIIRVAGEGLPGDRFWVEKPGGSQALQLGDIIEEHVQIINPEDRNYVAVVAPFSAGLEPMNPNLVTSPKEATPSGRNTREPTYAMYLDDEVRFYFEVLPKGTYDFYFRLRAMTEGSFVHPSAHAEAMYQPAVRGSSPGLRIVVKPRPEEGS